MAAIGAAHTQLEHYKGEGEAFLGRIIRPTIEIWAKNNSWNANQTSGVIMGHRKQ